MASVRMMAMVVHGFCKVTPLSIERSVFIIKYVFHVFAGHLRNMHATIGLTYKSNPQIML